MALTLEHLKTLSVEDLETLQRLHGDTLTHQEKLMIQKVIKEKTEGEGEAEQETEGEQERGQEQEQEREAAPQAESGPPEWWREPATADEIADKFMDRIAEAERIADEATGEGGEGESTGVEHEGSESDKEKEKAEKVQAGPGDKKEESTDQTPETEHWFYRGRRRKEKVTNE